MMHFQDLHTQRGGEKKTVETIKRARTHFIKLHLGA